MIACLLLLALLVTLVATDTDQAVGPDANPDQDSSSGHETPRA